MILDADLLKYNREGLIPGPHEDENAFMKRVSHCLGIKQKLKKAPHAPPLGEEVDDIATACGADPYALTQTLFDIKPTWIPMFFSNYQLAPWHGGCAWIFQLSPDELTAAFLQLRKGRSMFYAQSEIVAHEVAHVGRMAFEEPLFEELLAYQTSPYFWRRWLGPIVQSAKESTFFFLVLFLLIAFDAYLLVTAQGELLWLATWLKLLPAMAVVAAIIRLVRRHRSFNSTLAVLKATVGDLQRAQAIIYRLQDREIISFAKLDPAKIRQYAAQEKCLSLRWRLIALAYFNHQNFPVER